MVVGRRMVCIRGLDIGAFRGQLPKETRMNKQLCAIFVLRCRVNLSCAAVECEQKEREPRGAYLRGSRVRAEGESMLSQRGSHVLRRGRNVLQRGCNACNSGSAGGAESRAHIRSSDGAGHRERG